MSKKQVANVIILDKNDRFLIIKRTKTAPTHPLHWDLPGGHVDEGESNEEAAIRERVDAYQEPDPSGRSLAERARAAPTPTQTKEEKASDKAAESAGATRSRGGSREFGMNKGGLIKKPKKKKKTNKY